LGKGGRESVRRGQAGVSERNLATDTRKLATETGHIRPDENIMVSLMLQNAAMHHIASQLITLSELSRV